MAFELGKSYRLIGNYIVEGIFSPGSALTKQQILGVFILKCINVVPTAGKAIFEVWAHIDGEITRLEKEKILATMTLEQSQTKIF